MDDARQFEELYRSLEDEGTIGTGGMAVIRLLVDPRTGERYAAKVMAPQFMQNPDNIQRFIQEVKACRRLNHPNIIRVHGYGRIEGRMCLLMEYMDRGSLRELMDTVQVLSPSAACWVIRRLLSALVHAHDAGIVHRDLKPSNVLLGASGSIKLTDFGISKVEDFTRLTQSGAILGTPAFMSPEQARGDRADARSDLFSLGVMLCMMLTGVNPFVAESPGQTLMNILTRDPPGVFEHNPAIPMRLEAAVDRMLAKDPGDRFQSAGEALEEIAEIAGSITPEFDEAMWREYVADPLVSERRLRSQAAAEYLQRAELAYRGGEGSLDQAALDAYRSLRLNPANPEAAQFLTSISEREGLRFDQPPSSRIRMLEGELERNPTSVGILLQLVKLSRAEGDLIRAIVYSKRLKKLRGNDVYIMSQIETLLPDDDLRPEGTPGGAGPGSGVRRRPSRPASAARRGDARAPLPMVTMAPARRSNPFTIRLALLGALGLALILMIVWFGRSLGRYAESVTSGEEAAAHTREALSAREEATPGRAHGSAASLAGYRRAMELKRNSDFRGAAEMLERLAQEIPEGPVEAEVLYQLGQVYARLGDQLKADESFDYVISRYPETIHALLAHVGKAEVRRDNGDPEGAVWEFEAAVRLLPLDHDHKRRAEVLFKYAWLLAETQRSDAAIDAYKQIIELRADQETTARAYLEMAELQAKMGDVDLAKENYLEAKRTAPAASYVRRVADERLAELELIDRPLSGG